jgi:hypothetical protein
MTESDHKKVQRQLIHSLSSLVAILKKCRATYRILGSVNSVAYAKRVFRKIKDHLSITFLLVGTFFNDYFLYKYGLFRLVIQFEYIKPVQYTFEGISFTGFPIASVVDGIRQTSLNPKRKIDKHVLAEEMELFNKK